MGKQTKKGIYVKYSQESLEKAVSLIRSGTLSLRKAAQRFGIPRSTLSDHVTGKIQPGATPGKAPVLPREVEDHLASRATQAAAGGFGIGRKDIILRAAVLSKRMRINTPFRDGIPGKDWWAGFKARHPELSLRKPEALSTSRSRLMNPITISRYFADLGDILTRLNVIGTPERIWNADEVNKRLEHRPTTVVARKGSRGIPGRVSCSRESVTVLACSNAAGLVMPPLHIIKGKTRKALNAYNTAEGVQGAAWTYQSKAWMEDVLGVEWFRNVFLANCGPQRPQLLLLDSHSSHEVLGLLEKAKEEDIHIFTFPPHTTHYLQPLDRSCFGPLSAKYNQVCSIHLAKDPCNEVTKRSFPGLFAKAWDLAMTPANVKAGFAASGIYPFNPAAVPSSAYSPSVPFDTFRSDKSNPLSPDSAIIPSLDSIIVPSHDSATVDSVIVPSHDSAIIPSLDSIIVPSHDSATVDSVIVPSHDSAIIPSLDSIIVPSHDSATVDSVIVPSHDSAIILSLDSVIVPSHDSATVPVLDLAIVPSPDSATVPLLNSATAPLLNSATILSLVPETISALPSAKVSLPQQASAINAQDILQSLAAGGKVLSGDWNEDINTLFDLPPPPIKETKKKKGLTSHRLLTSDQIIKEKKQQLEERERKLKEKEERKRKRDEKKALKMKTAKVLTSCPPKSCNICLVDHLGSEDAMPWIQCTRCRKQMHQYCIPLDHQGVLIETICTKSPFVCHICHN